MKPSTKPDPARGMGRKSRRSRCKSVVTESETSEHDSMELLANEVPTSATLLNKKEPVVDHYLFEEDSNIQLETHHWNMATGSRSSSRTSLKERSLAADNIPPSDGVPDTTNRSDTLPQTKTKKRKPYQLESKKIPKLPKLFDGDKLFSWSSDNPIPLLENTNSDLLELSLRVVLGYPS